MSIIVYGIYSVLQQENRVDKRSMLQVKRMALHQIGPVVYTYAVATEIQIAQSNKSIFKKQYPS